MTIKNLKIINLDQSTKVVNTKKKTLGILTLLTLVGPLLQAASSSQEQWPGVQVAGLSSEDVILDFSSHGIKPALQSPVGAVNTVSTVTGRDRLPAGIQGTDKCLTNSSKAFSQLNHPSTLDLEKTKEQLIQIQEELSNPDDKKRLGDLIMDPYFRPGGQTVEAAKELVSKCFDLLSNIVDWDPDSSLPLVIVNLIQRELRQIQCLEIREAIQLEKAIEAVEVSSTLSSLTLLRQTVLLKAKMLIIDLKESLVREEAEEFKSIINWHINETLQQVGKYQRQYGNDLRSIVGPGRNVQWMEIQRLERATRLCEKKVGALKRSDETRGLEDLCKAIQKHLDLIIKCISISRQTEKIAKFADEFNELETREQDQIARKADLQETATLRIDFGVVPDLYYVSEERIATSRKEMVLLFLLGLDDLSNQISQAVRDDNCPQMVSKVTKNTQLLTECMEQLVKKLPESMHLGEIDQQLEQYLLRSKTILSTNQGGQPIPILGSLTAHKIERIPKSSPAETSSILHRTGGKQSSKLAVNKSLGATYTTVFHALPGFTSDPHGDQKYRQILGKLRCRSMETTGAIRPVDKTRGAKLKRAAKLIQELNELDKRNSLWKR
jgi:hypothetical protein